MITGLSMGLAGFASGEEPDGEDRDLTPVVRGFENFPFPVRVPRGLHELEPHGEPYEYNRTLPVLGAEAAQKGVSLFCLQGHHL